MHPTKFPHDILQALERDPANAVPVEDDQTKRVYFVYTEDLHLRATQALRVQEDLSAIQEGIEQMEAGLGRPLHEVDADIRQEFGFPPRK